MFLAKCDQQHQNGDTIKVVTKYGKKNECIVHNLIFSKDGFFYYSITRADGFDAQARAQAKADKLNEYAANAEKRAQQAYEASKEGADFLALGEPIKVGHHSEKRHRALIERNHRRFEKYMEETGKADTYENRAEYWENKANDINLSMPESIEYYTFKLEQAEKNHHDLKTGAKNREHSFSLTYAKKSVNEATKNLELAKKLWS